MNRREFIQSGAAAVVAAAVLPAVPDCECICWWDCVENAAFDRVFDERLKRAPSVRHRSDEEWLERERARRLRREEQ
jgi:hypothetical protein